MCHALSETSLLLETIDTTSRIMIQPQLHNWGQISFFCNYKDYKIALCVCGASTPSFHFWQWATKLLTPYTGHCNSHASLPKIKGALLIPEASSNLTIHFTNHANGSSNTQVLTWEGPNSLPKSQCYPSIRLVQLSVLVFCQQHMLLLQQ
jgi:hypothetical protein